MHWLFLIDRFVLSCPRYCIRGRNRNLSKCEIFQVGQVVLVEILYQVVIIHVQGRGRTRDLSKCEIFQVRQVVLVEIL